MSDRKAQITRKTKETNIAINLNIDGTGKSNIDTKVGFLDHMLISFSKHGRFDLDISCDGDTFIDDHHSVEDVGICLGNAFSKALGDLKGITRFADTSLVMDEALIFSAVDISKRDFLAYDLQIPTQKVGTFDTELIEEFFLAFVREANISLHIRQIAGKNSHHIIEATFKSVALSLKKALSIDQNAAFEIPSTKGVL